MQIDRRRGRGSQPGGGGLGIGMSKQRKKRRALRDRAKPEAQRSPEAGVQVLYDRACRCAEQGQLDEARRIYAPLAVATSSATSTAAPAASTSEGPL